MHSMRAFVDTFAMIQIFCVLILMKTHFESENIWWQVATSCV